MHSTPKAAGLALEKEKKIAAHSDSIESRSLLVTGAAELELTLEHAAKDLL